MICKHLLKVLITDCSKNHILNLPANRSKKYCKFRTGNTKLPIESGRFIIPRENKICKLCKSKDIGDEFHYLLKCTDAVI